MSSKKSLPEWWRMILDPEYLRGVPKRMFKSSQESLLTAQSRLKSTEGRRPVLLQEEIKSNSP
jgi:hypothetical protein